MCIRDRDYYVRFLPKNVEEFDRISRLGVELMDHPINREILRDGDYYHDPEGCWPPAMPKT